VTTTEILLAKLEKKHENWRAVLLGMYKEGASDREVLCALGLSKGGWDALMQDAVGSDFAELVDLGRLMAHAWWEGEGRKNLYNPKFQTGLWGLQMKNRYGYSEKTDQSMTTLEITNADDATLMRKVKELTERLNNGRGKTAV